jgi:hypothetical protein
MTRTSSEIHSGRVSAKLYDVAEERDDRVRTISLRLAESEFEQLRQLAEAAGENVSTYIRRVVFSAARLQPSQGRSGSSSKIATGVVGWFTTAGGSAYSLSQTPNVDYRVTATSSE